MSAPIPVVIKARFITPVAITVAVAVPSIAAAVAIQELRNA